MSFFVRYKNIKCARHDGKHYFFYYQSSKIALSRSSFLQIKITLISVLKQKLMAFMFDIFEQPIPSTVIRCLKLTH